MYFVYFTLTSILFFLLQVTITAVEGSDSPKHQAVQYYVMKLTRPDITEQKTQF